MGLYLAREINKIIIVVGALFSPTAQWTQPAE